MAIFLKNLALSRTTPHWPLTPCKVSGKNYELIPIKFQFYSSVSDSSQKRNKTTICKHLFLLCFEKQMPKRFGTTNISLVMFNINSWINLYLFVILKLPITSNFLLWSNFFVAPRSTLSNLRMDSHSVAQFRRKGHKNLLTLRQYIQILSLFNPLTTGVH